MSSLTRSLQSLLPALPLPCERDESYIAAAVDLRDLEHRLREIEARDHGGWSPIANGLYPR